VNVKRVRRLMRLMGLTPIYRKLRTNIPAKGHRLPGNGRANNTYIPLAKGFLYLVAIMDFNLAV
jgi:putative transposase